MNLVIEYLKIDTCKYIIYFYSAYKITGTFCYYSAGKDSINQFFNFFFEERV